VTEPLGTFCLVLHSHLPWLAHHGSWPVGEEWLYQAWAHSYLPVVDLLQRFAAEGKRDVLTLGVTPVLAAQLDDPYCLRGFHDWLGNWQLRAWYAGTHWQDKDLASYEHKAASSALSAFESQWRHGFSPVLRPLVDSGVVELLGGPATHPFQPLLEPRLREYILRTGLDDTELRLGHRPAGIWAPECGYSPGMESMYASAGVGHFLVDGPSLRGDTASARTVGSSDVVCFGRDLSVTYRVWSPRAGYPGHADYRDFHTYDHPSGLKPARVTGKHVPPHEKQPYSPARAAGMVHQHAADFVETVVNRLKGLPSRSMVVAAYDTELFGHWWHEGPAWLEEVLRTLPEAGVRVTTLQGALAAGHLGGPVDLPASSWGSGKDWRVWDGEQVADLVDAGAALQRNLLSVVDVFEKAPASAADQLVREALLALSSDWAFMVTKDSAADYARRRATVHGARFDELCELLRLGLYDRAVQRATELAGEDHVFGRLDARGLLTS
jgi:1,4-alpha-glucan branching enzyme